MELIKEVMINASFPSEEIEKKKDDINIEIKTRKDDIWTESRLVLRKLIYGDHPYSMDLIGNFLHTLFQIFRSIVYHQ